MYAPLTTLDWVCFAGPVAIILLLGLGVAVYEIAQDIIDWWLAR